MAARRCLLRLIHATVVQLPARLPAHPPRWHLASGTPGCAHRALVPPRRFLAASPASSPHCTGSSEGNASAGPIVAWQRRLPRNATACEFLTTRRALATRAPSHATSQTIITPPVLPPRGTRRHRQQPVARVPGGGIPRALAHPSCGVVRALGPQQVPIYTRRRDRGVWPRLPSRTRCWTHSTAPVASMWRWCRYVSGV